MKIVINSCCGGFSLSAKGLKRWLEMQGRQLYIYKRTKSQWADYIDEFQKISISDVDSSYVIYTDTDLGDTLTEYPEDTISPRDISRTDKYLIAVIEEMGGEEAGTFFSNLQVVDIEDGRMYKINSYDGYESIEYRDIDEEWKIADSKENE